MSFRIKSSKFSSFGLTTFTFFRLSCANMKFRSSSFGVTSTALSLSPRIRLYFASRCLVLYVSCASESNTRTLPGQPTLRQLRAQHCLQPLQLDPLGQVVPEVLRHRREGLSATHSVRGSYEARPRTAGALLSVHFFAGACFESGALSEVGSLVVPQKTPVEHAVDHVFTDRRVENGFVERHDAPGKGIVCG